MSIPLFRRRQVAANHFPVKHAWDALALGRIVLGGDPYGGPAPDWKTRLECFRFYFHTGGVRRLHVAQPRSGHLWSELGMALAIDLARGGDGEYTIEDELFYPTNGIVYRRLDWRIPTGAADAMYHRHSGPATAPPIYYHSRNPYFRIRSAQLKNMKIVVLVRSILDSLESRYVKFALALHIPEVTLDDDRSFGWDDAISRSINFFNSWGDVLQWHPNIMLCKFEDLKTDEVGRHKKILDFWGFDVPEDCIAEGFRRASKVEMKKRMPAHLREASLQVAERDKSQRGSLSESRKRHIIDRLSRELVYDLGYEFNYGTKYGAEYK
jgi:hypothetical protein